jgi:hypothetical protein
VFEVGVLEEDVGECEGVCVGGTIGGVECGVEEVGDGYGCVGGGVDVCCDCVWAGMGEC